MNIRNGRAGRPVKFSTRLFISYLLLCIVPVLTITNYYYVKAKEQIEEASTDFMQLFAAQLTTAFHTNITQVDHTSRTVFGDYNLINFLGNEALYSAGDQIRMNLAVQNLLGQYTTQLPYLVGASLLSASGRVYYTSFSNIPDSFAGDLQKKYMDRIREANGQLVVTPAHSQMNLTSGMIAGVFTAGRVVRDIDGRQAGVLLFYLTPYKLITQNESLLNLSRQYKTRIIVTTHDNHLVYDSSQTLLVQQDEIAPTFDSARYIVVRDQSPDFKIVVAIPRNVLDNKISLYRNIAMASAAVVALVIAAVSVFLSLQITKPINRLIKSMKLAEDGLYNPIPERPVRDELDVLTHHYNRMIRTIKHLIEDVYLARLKQNQAKFLALQNQINPHWLNNTLESIRMEALLSNAPNVAAMIKSLGRMFQMALAKRSQDNRLADELEYVSVYVRLQNIRYNDRFELELDVPEPLKEAPLLKLVLQPIVENSILHGCPEHGRTYRIRIAAQASGGCLTLTVADDGVGMTADALRQVRARMLLPEPELEPEAADPNRSIGLSNIQQRLQLHYGDGYGLSIDAAEGAGTTVRITLPEPTRPATGPQAPDSSH